jgi:anti-anti-sigma factor
MRSASPGLEISVDRRSTAVGELAVIRAEGEVDLNSAEQLAAALRAESRHHHAGVVLDLLGVPFMDSTGLRALLLATGEIGDHLAVVLSPGSPVLRLLEVAEVSGRIRAFASAEEAVDAVASGAHRSL